jgi:hypothetical protein
VTVHALSTYNFSNGIIQLKKKKIHTQTIYENDTRPLRFVDACAVIPIGACSRPAALPKPDTPIRVCIYEYDFYFFKWNILLR